MASAIRLLLFAAARDLVGEDEISFPLVQPCSAQDLLERVCEAHPKLAPYRKALRVAVNGAYAAWTDPVTPGDEVAIIPPVAGG